MAFTSIDDVVAGLQNGKTLRAQFESQSATTGIISPVPNNGINGGWGGTLAVPGNANAGGTNFGIANHGRGFPTLGTPSAGKSWYLGTVSAFAISTDGAHFSLVDRVWACRGMNATLTTAQTVTDFPALNRYSTGAGLEMYLETYGSLGGTSRTITVNYTNQDGVAGRTSRATVIPTNLQSQKMIQIFLADGDSGVRSVESVLLSGSTGTAGDFGITLVKKFAATRCGQQNCQSNLLDVSALGIQKVDNNCCFQFFYFANPSGGVRPTFDIRIFEGDA